MTEVGINQAIELGHKIKDLSLSVSTVLSSPLNRAYTTASIVSSINNYFTPIIENLLIERDFGIMSGKKHSDIIPMCSPNTVQAEKITYFLCPEGAETFPDLIVRSNNLLQKLEKTYINKKILLVSHGDFGKMFYCAYYKLDWRDVLTSFHFGNSELLLISEDTDPNKSKIINIEQFNV